MSDVLKVEKWRMIKDVEHIAELEHLVVVLNAEIVKLKDQIEKRNMTDEQLMSDQHTEIKRLKEENSKEYLRGRDAQMAALKDADHSWQQRAEIAEAQIEAAARQEPCATITDEYQIIFSADGASKVKPGNKLYAAPVHAMQTDPLIVEIVEAAKGWLIAYEDEVRDPSETPPCKRLVAALDALNAAPIPAGDALTEDDVEALRMVHVMLEAPVGECCLARSVIDGRLCMTALGTLELVAPAGDTVSVLPPLTDAMYHAVRGMELEFSSGGPESVIGCIDDETLDNIWESINTALRVQPK